MSDGNPTVEYRAIPDYPGYRVGNDGSVWTCLVKSVIDRQRAPGAIWQRLKLRKTAKGYVTLQLYSGRKPRHQLVHRLVLESFVGKSPFGMQCAHENGVRDDNRLVNLSWKTPKENQADRRRHGTHICGEKQGSSKLADSDIEKIFRDRRAGMKLKALAKKYGVGFDTVRRILKGRTWQHVSLRLVKGS